MLNGGEDFNENGTLQVYGETPWNGDVAGVNYVPAGAIAPFERQHAGQLESVGQMPG